MSIPDARNTALNSFLLLIFLLFGSLGVTSCVSKGTVSQVSAKPVPETKPTPSAVATWLGNPERNFYGTGPWPDGQLQIIWEVKTGSTSGRLSANGTGNVATSRRPLAIRAMPQATPTSTPVPAVVSRSRELVLTARWLRRGRARVGAPARSEHQ